MGVAPWDCKVRLLGMSRGKIRTGEWWDEYEEGVCGAPPAPAQASVPRPLSAGECYVHRDDVDRSQFDYVDRSQFGDVAR